ncbi:winged helix-turn-helix domain-containing protein [Arthrobacter sp. ok362]|jgi:predicted ArsR family transcriptional regulator|uniref:winged helix-turn-helix domain-containing protein n=1 Tax=Arthrobacter sp. ok362 TaxID=1761745 RepID=UPI00087F2BEF|nr:regulatory protein, arsR family [Arthrobacter sp. ok362]
MTAVQSPMDVHRIERTNRARSAPIRSKIIDYLVSHGASKVADISDGIASSRGSVRYHLAALESASIVRSNISPGARGRFTPFYGIAPERAESDF